MDFVRWSSEIMSNERNQHSATMKRQEIQIHMEPPQRNPIEEYAEKSPKHAGHSKQR